MGRVFVAARGATRLHIGVLAANEPARRFYEAIGGRLVGSRPYEEDGYTLEEAVYAWEIERLVHAE
jgi:RimJ/RimL family protein N-acetyltransferase